MASMKTKLADNLQQKLHPKKGLIVSGFGLCIAAASFIIFSLLILIPNKITPTTSMVSWTFSLPNTPLTTSTENLGNGSESGTHFENLDLKLKNVSFHGLEEEEESRVFINVSRNSLNIDKLGLRNSGVLRKDCDIFDGKWVRDDELPHYPPGICPFIDRDFNCHLNGRPDDGYYRWKWQPFGCNIPRLNATDFLERMRGKKLVYIGDSLNRNMWESLVCILWHSIKDKNTVYEVSGKREFKKEGIYAIRFEDYNCTIDYVRAPFLVRESTFQKNNGSLSTLRLDLMDETTQMYHDAHILVFNTGHWWTHEKTSRGEEYYQEGDLVHPRLKALKAYRKALATWGRWVDRHIDYKKTLVFFRGYSGTHFRGGQWNSGGQCHKETEPIFNETYLGKYPSKMRALEQVLGKMKTPVMYLNISRLTDYRKDAHPSIYRKSYESEDERIEAEQSQDCSHWCLPGVPDLWNELLYASLLKVGWGSQSQGT
ncbi:protein trichome birefringence-like 2 [Chenopodium quinoa]|uniref:protein trichome birefringence-like 2 n=1 Tax=Chenopodium quinoa TaxID=63459 RepID=UPI000B78D576|nr:protein trichome birefringence-like 2 [Chenopodium quinoa]